MDNMEKKDMTEPTAQPQHTTQAEQPEQIKKTKTKKRREKKSLPLFYTVYFICIAAAVLFLVIALFFVHGWLKEFESVQIKHAEEAVYEEYFKDFSYENLTEYFSVTQFLEESGIESEDELFEKLNSEIKGKTTSYFKSNQNEDGSLVTYTVTIDKKRVATFTLKKDGEPTRSGQIPYVLDSILIVNPLTGSEETIPPTYLYTYTVKAPKGWNVSVNGSPLSVEDSHGTEYGEKSFLASFKSGFEGMPYVSYDLELEAPPSVTATDENGNEHSATYDEAMQTYIFAPLFDQSIIDEHGEHAITVAKKLAIYMQAGGGFESVSSYYDPNSLLYEQIRVLGKDAWMVKKYDSCDFENASVSEPYQYSDTEFSLRVAITQIGHKEGRADSIDHLDYTFCFHLVDGNWLIYESYNN